MKHLKYYIILVFTYLAIYLLSHLIISSELLNGYDDVVISYTILDKMLEYIGISIRYGMLRLVSLWIACHFIIYGVYSKKVGKPHPLYYLIIYSLIFYALIPVIW